MEIVLLPLLEHSGLGGTEPPTEKFCLSGVCKGHTLLGVKDLWLQAGLGSQGWHGSAGDSFTSISPLQDGTVWGLHVLRFSSKSI